MMKRIFTLLAAATLGILPLAATVPAVPDPADVKMETKSYPLSGFSELQVGWTYQVALTQADRYSVRVEAPDFVVPYLDVKVTGDRLVLDITEMPKDIRKKVEMALKRNEIRAWVAMPNLSGLRMSGAARLNATGRFSAKRFDFKMDLSGATVVEGLNVAAGEADIRCSGAAKFGVRGDFADMKLNLSGAASGSLEAGKKVDETEMEVSGAVKCTLTGDFKKLDMEVSGAANCKLEGSVRDLNLEASGAAKADLLGAPADNAEVDLAGAAKVELQVQKTLKAELAGASTCRYKAGPDLRITEQTVSRGSALKRL